MTPNMSQRAAVKAVQKVVSRPAPTGGLNYSTSYAAGQIGDALVCKNWIAYKTSLRMRGGWTEHRTGAGSPINSLMSWYSAASKKLFAATKDGIYDVSSPGAGFPAASIALSGAANAGVFSYLNFPTAGTPYLVACSETDGYHRYDSGGGWVKVTAGAGAGQISGGPLPGNFAYVCSWKRRLLFVKANDTIMYYLPVDSVAGAAGTFQFGPTLRHGGTLVALLNWTLNGGFGIDDYLVAVGSKGDVAVYKGTDPADPNNFVHVGTWYLGDVPVGRRWFTSWGGDILFATSMGIIPLSVLVQGGLELAEQDQGSYTNRIQSVVGDLVDATGANAGWEWCSFAGGNVLLLQTPVSDTGVYTQYVLNYNSRRWTTFEGIPTITMQAHERELYFGTSDGRVGKMLSGNRDGVTLADPTTGSPIVADLLTVFDHFGAAGQYKRFLQVRPTLIAEGTPGVSVQMNPDYVFDAVGGTPVFTDTVGDLWDSAKWDVAKWAGGQFTVSNWEGLEGIGYLGALYLRVSGLGGTELLALDYLVEIGGAM